MTDKEIIKALECCAMQSYPACRECPYHEQYSNKNCIAKRNVDIEALINRQKAEISELQHKKNTDLEIKLIAMRGAANSYKAEVERLEAESQMADGYADALVERAKSEAIKEFAELIKKYFPSIAGAVDSLAKEMKEGAQE